MFTIPNSAVANYPRQAVAMSSDMQALQAALKGTSVLTGCAVTESGPADGNYNVAAGEVAVNGARVVVAGGIVTPTAAHATLERMDLIVVSNAGVKSVTAGVPAAAGSAALFTPDIPANSCLLYAIYVPAAKATFQNIQLTDKRVEYDPLKYYTECYRSSSQSIPNNVGTDIAWNAEAFDIPGWHAGTDAFFTVSKTGMYIFNADILWGLAANGFRDMWFTKNGGGYFGRQRVINPGATYNPYMNKSWTAKLTAGNTVGVRVQQDSGGALDLLADETRFAITYLGPSV